MYNVEALLLSVFSFWAILHLIYISEGNYTLLLFSYSDLHEKHTMLCSNIKPPSGATSCNDCTVRIFWLYFCINPNIPILFQASSQNNICFKTFVALSEHFHFMPQIFQFNSVLPFTLIVHITDKNRGLLLERIESSLCFFFLHPPPVALLWTSSLPGNPEIMSQHTGSSLESFFNWNNTNILQHDFHSRRYKRIDEMQFVLKWERCFIVSCFFYTFLSLPSSVSQSPPSPRHSLWALRTLTRPDCGRRLQGWSLPQQAVPWEYSVSCEWETTPPPRFHSPWTSAKTQKSMHVQKTKPTTLLSTMKLYLRP